MRTVFSLGVVGAHSGPVALAELCLDAPVERVVLHQLEVNAALALLHSLIEVEFTLGDYFAELLRIVDLVD